MNKIDRSTQFDSQTIRDALRNAPSDRDRLPEPEELNRLARQTARRLAQESYTPAMITGLLRLGEFAALFLTGLAIYLGYVGDSMRFTVFYYGPALLAGSALAVLLGTGGGSFSEPAPFRFERRALRATGLAAHAGGAVDRTWSALEVGKLALEFREELGVMLVLRVRNLEFVDGVGERFAHEAAAVDAEMASGVGLLISLHGESR